MCIRDRSKPALVLESEAKTTPSLVLIPTQYVMTNSYLKNNVFTILNFHSYYLICAIDNNFKTLKNHEMVNLWKKYDSKKTFDEYLNSENKLRRQAVIISHILERHGIKKLNEIEKNCASTISARGINFRVYESGKKINEKKWPLDIIPRIILKKDWSKVSKGLLQRVKALNLFIDDVYNLSLIHI